MWGEGQDCVSVIQLCVVTFKSCIQKLHSEVTFKSYIQRCSCMWGLVYVGVSGVYWSYMYVLFKWLYVSCIRVSV